MSPGGLGRPAPLPCSGTGPGQLTADPGTPGQRSAGWGLRTAAGPAADTCTGHPALSTGPGTGHMAGRSRALSEVLKGARRVLARVAGSLGVPGGTGEYRNSRCYPTRETGCSGRSAPPGAAPTGTPRPPRGLPGIRSPAGGRGGGAARGRRKPKHRLRGGREVRASPGQREEAARCRLREREGSPAAPSTAPPSPFPFRCLSFPGPPPAPQCRCPPPARP